jgi:hypothetical protein
MLSKAALAAARSLKHSSQPLSTVPQSGLFNRTVTVQTRTPDDKEAMTPIPGITRVV